MKALVLFVVLNLVAFISKAQLENEIVLLTVKSDRLELAKALRFLKANEPKLICLNVDLMKCDNIKHFKTNHFNNDTTAMMTPSESEEKLFKELDSKSWLLMPSELRPFGSEGTYLEITGCVFLYPDGVTTGFVNLIDNGETSNQVEWLQISNTYENEPIEYHFAVRIALQIDEKATRSYIKSHPNVITLDFDREKKFETYNIEHFYGNKESGKSLKGKVIIVSFLEEYLVLANKKKMTASEIFANVACQLVE